MEPEKCKKTEASDEELDLGQALGAAEAANTGRGAPDGPQEEGEGETSNERDPSGEEVNETSGRRDNIY